MSVLAFPTRPPRRDGTAFPAGYPLRAQPCACEDRQRPDPHDGSRCVRCGRFPARVIDQTWAARARQAARG